MSEQNDHKEQFNYDIASERIIVGPDAYDDAIESGIHPDDIISLQQALTSPDCEMNRSDAVLDVDGWSVDDYLSYGRWINSIVDTPLAKKHLQRAYELGAGPEPQKIYRREPGSKQPRFKGFGEFFSEVGAKGSLYRYEYDNLSFVGLMDIVKSTADSFANRGVRPTAERYNELAKDGKVPSKYVIKRITGHAIGSLIGMAGYPNTSTMSDEDVVEWGVRFTTVNGRLPYDGGLKALSKRFRGPSKSAIERRFGGILGYQASVSEAYEKHREHEEKTLQAKLDDIKLDVESGLLPDSIVETADIDELLRNVAQFRVANSLIGDSMIPSRVINVAQSTDSTMFVRRVRKHNPNISEADIEVKASLLGVFDDIWVFNEYFDWLRVDDK